MNKKELINQAKGKFYLLNLNCNKILDNLYELTT
jgi:hypothetical protein